MDGADVLFYDVKQTARRLGLGARTVWRRINDDPQFPKPVRQKTRRTLLLAEDVEAYVDRLREGCTKQCRK